MPTAAGPNSNEQGLVFAYDLADIKNSYAGEPTNNLFGTTAMEFKDDYGVYTNNIESGTDTIGKYFIKDTVNAPWWSGLRIYQNGISPLTAGVSYVLSFECRSPQSGWSWSYDSNASGGGWSGNDLGRASNTNLVFDKTGGITYTSDMVNTWQRVSYRVTMKDATTFTGASAYPHDSFFTNANNTKIYYRNPQLEVGRTTATRYTPSSRSSTQGLLDLTGNKTINLNNISFDSNGQITFDGTDDYITVTPGKQYTIAEPWTTELVFKPTDQNDTSWNGLFGGYLSAGGYWMFHSGGSLTYYEGHDSVNNSTKITYRSWNKENTFTAGVYHHLTIVYTPGVAPNGNFDIYYNGGQKVDSFVRTFTWNYSLDMQFIGSGAGNRHGTNDIHYFRQYSRSLSAEEVANNYNVLKKRFNI